MEEALRRSAEAVADSDAKRSLQKMKSTPDPVNHPANHKPPIVRYRQPPKRHPKSAAVQRRTIRDS